MNAKSALNIASVVVVLAVVAVAALLAPPTTWSAAAICAVALLALASGQVLFGSQLLPSSARHGGDAAMLAALGPMGLLVIGYLAWSVLTFAIALQGHERTSWAMIVAGVAGVLVGRLALHAALESVDSAAARTAVASPTAHWKEALRLAAPAASGDSRSRIEKLIDRVDFGPSEPAGSPLPVSAEITSAVDGLAHALRGDASALEALIGRIDGLLSERDSQVRLLRSKA